MDRPRHDSRTPDHMLYHLVAVWVDHKEAKVIRANLDSPGIDVVHAHGHHSHKHPSETHDRSHPSDTKQYYHAIADAVKDAGSILLLGPGSAKTELKHHLDAHDATVARKVVGVETVDHPTDAQLIAYVRSYAEKHANL